MRPRPDFILLLGGRLGKKVAVRLKEKTARTTCRVDDFVVIVNPGQLDGRFDNTLRREILSFALFDVGRAEYT